MFSRSQVFVFVALLTLIPGIAEAQRGGYRGEFSWFNLLWIPVAVIAIVGPVFAREIKTAAQYLGGLALIFGVSLWLGNVLFWFDLIPRTHILYAGLAFFVLIVLLPFAVDFLAEKARAAKRGAPPPGNDT